MCGHERMRTLSIKRGRGMIRKIFLSENENCKRVHVVFSFLRKKEKNSVCVFNFCKKKQKEG